MMIWFCHNRVQSRHDCCYCLIFDDLDDEQLLFLNNWAINCIDMVLLYWCTRFNYLQWHEWKSVFFLQQTFRLLRLHDCDRIISSFIDWSPCKCSVPCSTRVLPLFCCFFCSFYDIYCILLSNHNGFLDWIQLESYVDNCKYTMTLIAMNTYA